MPRQREGCIDIFAPVSLHYTLKGSFIVFFHVPLVLYINWNVVQAHAFSEVYENTLQNI